MYELRDRLATETIDVPQFTEKDVTPAYLGYNSIQADYPLPTYSPWLKKALFLGVPLKVTILPLKDSPYKFTCLPEHERKFAIHTRR